LFQLFQRRFQLPIQSSRIAVIDLESLDFTAFQVRAILEAFLTFEHGSGKSQARGYSALAAIGPLEDLEDIHGIIQLIHPARSSVFSDSAAHSPAGFSVEPNGKPGACGRRIKKEAKMADGIILGARRTKMQDRTPFRRRALGAAYLNSL